MENNNKQKIVLALLMSGSALVAGSMPDKPRPRRIYTPIVVQKPELPQNDSKLLESFKTLSNTCKQKAEQLIADHFGKVCAALVASHAAAAGSVPTYSAGSARFKQWRALKKSANEKPADERCEETPGVPEDRQAPMPHAPVVPVEDPLREQLRCFGNRGQLDPSDFEAYQAKENLKRQAEDEHFADLLAKYEKDI